MNEFLTRVGIRTVNTDGGKRPEVELMSARQDWKVLTPDRSCHTLTPIRIGSKSYLKGLGAHANGRAVFQLNAGFKRFVAEVGVDNNSDTGGTKGTVVFIVKADGKTAAQTPVCRGGEQARKQDVSVSGVHQLELIVTDAGDGYSYDQADWAEAKLVRSDGSIVYLSDILRESQRSSFLDQKQLPASFVYNGKPSLELLETWPREDKQPIRLADRTVYETTWREPNGGLAATWRVEAFRDSSSVEFRWIFRNEGAEPSKPLSKVLALDLQTGVDDGTARLVHSTGGLTGNMQDADLGFNVESTKLGAMTLSGAGGRSSNRDLPFFQIHSDASQNGIFVGVGWSGQWRADCLIAEGKLRVTAEMDGMNLELPPGETLLTPSILLGAYRGEAEDGSNCLRRILCDHYVPRLNGRKVDPPVSWNSWFVLSNSITEKLLKREADIASKIGVEYFCIDAGWFEGLFPDGVGNWTIEKSKFPNGLKPIGDYVRSKGMKLGLWFEPERVAANTRLLKEHPEWVHNDLLDFGNRDAREWVFQMMKRYLDEGGVRWIRFDFNTEPLSTWNLTDSPETRGLSQARHIAGLYELLDRLMAAYPDLLIEGCASGGRRIDLETIKRSHTFWKSDDTEHLPVMRFHETGGNTFLPSTLLNANLIQFNSKYDILSLFGGPLGFGLDWTKLDADKIAIIGKLVKQYKKLRTLMSRDYYPLFPQSRTESGWIGWQFNDPEAGGGFAVVLHPVGSVYQEAKIRFRGLVADKEYAVSFLGGKAVKVKGRTLLDGWTVRLEKPGTGLVMRIGD